MQRRVSKAGTLSIVAVPDPELGRERAQSLVRTWAILRTLGPLQVLPEGTTEKDLLAYLSKNPADLVLLPWKQYLEWTRIEGHFGIARSSGPTCAGYFASPMDSKDLGLVNDYQRLIVLDFVHTNFSERWRMVHALLDEKNRTGLGAIIQDNSVVLEQHWLGSTGPGPTLDAVISLDFLNQTHWRDRIEPLQLLTVALWNLAFEEGRALNRGGWLSKIHAKRTRAFFQITHDQEVLALRLCYKQNPNSPRSVLHDFWPDPWRCEEFRQLLVKHSDFLRVHPVAEHSEIEIVAGLLKSAPARKRPDEFRTIWIEPIHARLMNEIPLDTDLETGPDSSHEAAHPLQRRPLLKTEQEIPVDAQAKIQWLEHELEKKEKKIRELTAGLGTDDSGERSA